MRQGIDEPMHAQPMRYLAATGGYTGEAHTVAELFATLGKVLCDRMTDSLELSICLYSLVAARDHAVRAALAAEGQALPVGQAQL